MKELLCSYAVYNKWANEQLLGVVLDLTEEQQHQKIISSFEGLYPTWLHLLKAETIWWQRLNQLTINEITNGTFKPTMHELVELLQQQDALWIGFVNELATEKYEKNFAYKNLKGEAFEQPLFEVLHHLFNHSTYHRGQIVTMLRQVGVEKIPATDFVHWVKKNK